mmetsp:Transcript_5516/g.12466  ORF Transcript_5516/g.12466 Transcript_5516/m.12466 type:complete len:408 (+) Transcript_5516:440-1663(+)
MRWLSLHPMLPLPEAISVDSLPFLVVWLLIVASVFSSWLVARENRDRHAAGLSGGQAMPSSSGSPKRCGSISCPKTSSMGGEQEGLLACSICRSAWYCSKECQKNAWTKEGHKYCCAKPDVPRIIVDGNYLDDVKSAIDKANPGDIVELKEGDYQWKRDCKPVDMKDMNDALKSKKKANGDDALVIDKPIKIWGPPGGIDSVQLNCQLVVDQGSSLLGDVLISNLTVKPNILVKTNNYKSVTFSCVRSQQDDEDEDGVRVHIMRGGKCLFFRCEIIGGTEALYIDGIDQLSQSQEDNEDRVHLKRCVIRNGAKRGICADDKFILEATTISDNGWYGIRSNKGWTDKGKNDWQKNPMKPNQGPSSGNGMFDGIAMSTPMGSLSIGGHKIPVNSVQTGDTAFPGFGKFK